MAIPASYTEETLAAFMLATLKQLGAVLGLALGDFEEAVNETLLAYGVANIADATDVPRLRALAKVEAWKVAQAQAGSRIDWSEAGASFKQSQYRTAVKDGLELAIAEATKAGYIAEPPSDLPGYEVMVGTLGMYDPYAGSE